MRITVISRGFLKRNVEGLEDKVNGGWFVDKNGKKLGQHKGYPFYTIGQRKGLDIALGKPAYVTAIDPDTNTVILGEESDLEQNDIKLIADLLVEFKIDAIIATNTTISRDGLDTPAEEVQKIGMGGLSGKPVKERSTEVIRYLAKKGQKKFAIIGVGGISTAADAHEKLEAGADLVQVYSGFIYEGPAIVKNICKGLLAQK